MNWRRKSLTVCEHCNGGRSFFIVIRSPCLKKFPLQSCLFNQFTCFVCWSKDFNNSLYSLTFVAACLENFKYKLKYGGKCNLYEKVAYYKLQTWSSMEDINSWKTTCNNMTTSWSVNLETLFQLFGSLDNHPRNYFSALLI